LNDTQSGGVKVRGWKERVVEARGGETKGGKGR